MFTLLNKGKVIIPSLNIGIIYDLYEYIYEQFQLNGLNDNDNNNNNNDNNNNNNNDDTILKNIKIYHISLKNK